MAIVDVPASHLSSRLSDIDWRVRRGAVLDLAETAPCVTDDERRDELMASVIALRGDSLWQVREAVACTLGRLEGGILAVEALVALARDWRPEVVLAAIGALSKIYSAEASSQMCGSEALIVEALALAATERHEEQIHAAALAAFPTLVGYGGMDYLAAALAVRLGHDDADTRERAVESLVLLSGDASTSVVTAAMGQLRHTEGHVRIAAVHVFTRVGLRDDSIVEALLLAARDHDIRVRQAAGNAMLQLVESSRSVRYAPAKAAIVDGIVQLLAHEDPHVRATAIDILGRIASPGHEAASAALAGCLDDDVDELRHRAAKSLKAIVRPGDADVLVAVAARVAHPEGQVRAAACTALRHVAADHDTFSVALVSQHLGSTDPRVRASVASELDSLLPYADDNTVQTIFEFLGHEDEGVRKDAVAALSKCEVAKTRLHVDKLVQVYAAMSRPFERQAALEALGHVGSVGDAAVRDCLIDRLDDDISGVRAAACDSLSKLFCGDPVAVSMLVERLPTRTASVCAAMLAALSRIAVQGDEAAAVAAACCLEDRCEETRDAAVYALKRLCAGGGCIAVKAAIVKSLDTANPGVRRSVVEALVTLVGRSSGDPEAIMLIAEVLNVAQSWGVRCSAAEAFQLISIDGGQGSTAAAISRLASARDESIWKCSLPSVLASLCPVVAE